MRPRLVLFERFNQYFETDDGYREMVPELQTWPIRCLTICKDVVLLYDSAIESEGI
jgi:hypothetical protein